ncbi:MAG: trypsin-like peptidase domain-containing protein, partial [Fimbriimonas ginsengisoli]|nr:trypsin-like peptidase domain-containing protein [Fimbriimonas ginsengisoli]
MKTNLLQSTTFWTLALGIVIGGVSVASILSSSRAAPGGPPVSIQARPIGLTRTESLLTLKALDDSLVRLAEYATPAVVHIRAETEHGRNIFGKSMPIAGEGSGVIFRADGYIVTNDHVAGGFEKVKVILNDGREFAGKVIRGEDSDITVVKIDAKDLPTLAFADSGKVKPGQFAIAIGSPFSLENSVTIGHVSATGRTNSIPDMRMGSRRVYTDLIQTDAPINMGNSGGPLINSDGEIIGINTSIYSQSGGSNGIGFAIPSNQARTIAELLIEKGKIVRGAIGLVPSNLKEYQKKEMKLDGGALVVKVPSNGPAAAAGIKENDVIVRIGSLPVNSQMDLRNALLRYGPGEKVDVEYVRDGKHRTSSVALTDPKSLEKLTYKDEPGGPGDMPRGNQDFPFDFHVFKGFDDVPGLAPDKTPHTGKPRLGVALGDLSESLRGQYGIPKDVKGAVVQSVMPGSLADRVLNMRQGDVILEMNGKTIDGPQRVKDVMSGLSWGDTLSIRFGHYGKEGT